MFSKPLSPFEEPKTNKSVFQSELEVLPCFELSYKFLERHKKPLLLVTTRKQENPVNTAQNMASKSSTRQDGEVTIPLFVFRLETSFLSVLSKRCGNLRKDFIDKWLVNSVKYHYLSLRLVSSWFKKFKSKCKNKHKIQIKLSRFKCVRLTLLLIR